MSTSLASQLAARQTLDSSRLATLHSLKSPPSLLFTPSQSSKLSTSSLADLASSAWDSLSNLDPFFENAKYNNLILGEEARRSDRAGFTREENERIDRTVERVLRALGKWAALRDAGVVVEWLIRRFRVNDLNPTALISLFLPYHSTPHFPTLLSLIPISTLLQTPYAPLNPLRSSLLPVELPSLIASLHSSPAYLQQILDLPKKYLQENETVPRVVSAFWLQVLAGFLEGQKSLQEEVKAIFLGSVLDILKLASGRGGKKDDEDVIIAGFILLTRFLSRNLIQGDKLKVVLKSVAIAGAGKKDDDQGDREKEKAMLTTLIVLTGLSNEIAEKEEGKLWLGKTGWKGLMRIRDLSALLISLSNNYATANFMTPFLSTLVSEAATDSNAQSLLSSLLLPNPSNPTQVLPPPIISLILSTVLSQLLSSQTTSLSDSPLLKPLSQIHQRYPLLWEKSTQQLVSSSSASEAETTGKLWEIISLVISNGVTSSLLLDTSTTSDPSIRLFALKELLNNQSTELMKTEAGAKVLRESLEIRLKENDDDEDEVSETLLGGDQVGKKVIEAVFSGDEIGSILMSDNRSTTAVGARVRYLLGAFLEKFDEKVDEVVKKVVWERILKTKVGGEGLAIEGKVAEFSWFKGVKEGMNNADLTKLIAENIAGLENGAELENGIDFLLKKIGGVGKDGNGKILAMLVMINIVEIINPRLKVDLVGRVLESLEVLKVGGLDSLSSSLSPDDNNTLQALESQIFSNSTLLKTLQRAQTLLLLTSTSSIAPPPSSSWEWLSTPTSSDQTSFVSLIKKVYSISHTGTTPSSKNLGSKLLSSLLGDNHSINVDALSFFASIWIDLRNSDSLRRLALEEAGVFVMVNGEKDWQIVVPSVVGALMDEHKGVREEAFKLLHRIKEGLGGKEVYGRSVFYGVASSKEVKYLDMIDVSAYLDKLIGFKTEIIMDPKFITILHSSLLDESSSTSTSSPKKKKSSLLHKVTLFLLSHITAWDSILGKTRLFTALEGVKDQLKNDVATKVLKDLIKDRSEINEDVGELVRLLLSIFGGGISKKWIEGNEKPLETFWEALETIDEKGCGAIIRREALRVIRTSLFATLRGENKLELFRKMVRLAAGTESRAASEVLECLRACKLDAETVTSFLGEIRLSISSPVSKNAKRNRTSLGSASSRADRISELVVVLESLDFTAIAPSHSLVLGAFDLLSSVIEVSASAQVDIQYPGQLILSTLSKLISNAQPSSGVTSDSIRMTPVLDFMRASTNPQTSHQALMLLSQLGPLVPDQLVHNVMPIFTFMGANVLQRDDAYSLRVVEQALDSILPALVSSMKKTAGGRDGLVSDLKDLLRVFTDAASHVPRHRRVKLFVRLVEKLGPREFLSAVTMLLLESGRTGSDASALPLSVLEGFAVDVQLLAFGQIIEEASRILQGDSSEASILFTTADESAPQTTFNLVTLLSEALESKQLGGKVDAVRAATTQDIDTTFFELVRALLDLSKLSASISNAKFDIAAAASECIQATVHLMSPESFSEAILWLVDLNDSGVQSGAFELLRMRLPTLKPARRGDVSSAVVTVVERIRASLVDPSADHEALLVTLDAIVSSPFPDEDLVLSKTLPDLLELVVAASTSKVARTTSLEIIRKLTSRLGARLIPLASKIIPFCVALLQAEASHPATASPSVVASAFRILEALFASIPTFIGTQLDTVLKAILSSEVIHLTLNDVHSAKARIMLLSTSAKRLPAKTLYPSIIRLHATLELTEKTPTLGLLDVLNRALRHGKAVDIAKGYRPIFKLFLTVFDLRRVPPPSLSLEDVAEVEDNALGAFVQFILKLSEQTFRPIFLRTYDWAVIDLAEDGSQEALNARRVVLYKLFDRLLVQLKSIVVPYFSFMIDQTIELLDGFAKGGIRDSILWTAVVSALTKSIEYDETGFWTSARLSKLSTPIATQIQSPNPLAASVIANELHPLVAIYAHVIGPHDKVLKAFNTSLLMLTRSDDLRVKRGALEVLEQVWESLGDGMLGLVPETTPFLSETMEETEGGVEVTTRRLIAKIESHLGETLQEYLEN